MLQRTSRVAMSSLFAAAVIGFAPVRAEAPDEARAMAAATAREIGIAAGLGTLRDRPREEIEAEFADYAALGVRWLRTDIYWSNVQPDAPDKYDWSVIDRVVSAAQAHGLRVLPVVGTTPPWARSIPGERSAPRDPSQYAAFIAAAAARYAPLGIHVWEIWNEPNLFGSWPPAPDAIAYARLLIAASAAIRAVDPEATVLLGGLSPVVDTRPGKFISATEFLAAIYDAGAGDAFDAVAFHPYSFPRRPEDPADWTGWNIMTGPIRALMTAHGDGDKKIWITEIGAPTNAINSKVTEVEQAEMLAQAVELARGYDWAGPVFWYSFQDLGTDPANNEDWFGLRRADGAEKPAYRALKAITAEH